MKFRMLYAKSVTAEEVYTLCRTGRGSAITQHFDQAPKAFRTYLREVGGKAENWPLEFPRSLLEAVQGNNLEAVYAICGFRRYPTPETCEHITESSRSQLLFSENFAIYLLETGKVEMLRHLLTEYRRVAQTPSVLVHLPQKLRVRYCDDYARYKQLVDTYATCLLSPEVGMTKQQLSELFLQVLSPAYESRRRPTPLQHSRYLYQYLLDTDLFTSPARLKEELRQALESGADVKFRLLLEWSKQSLSQLLSPGVVLGSSMMYTPIMLPILEECLQTTPSRFADLHLGEFLQEAIRHNSIGMLECLETAVATMRRRLRYDVQLSTPAVPRKERTTQLERSVLYSALSYGKLELAQWFLEKSQMRLQLQQAHCDVFWKLVARFPKLWYPAELSTEKQLANLEWLAMTLRSAGFDLGASKIEKAKALRSALRTNSAPLQQLLRQLFGDQFLQTELASNTKSRLRTSLFRGTKVGADTELRQFLKDQAAFLSLEDLQLIFQNACLSKNFALATSLLPRLRSCAGVTDVTFVLIDPKYTLFQKAVCPGKIRLLQFLVEDILSATTLEQLGQLGQLPMSLTAGLSRSVSMRHCQQLASYLFGTSASHFQKIPDHRFELKRLSQLENLLPSYGRLKQIGVAPSDWLRYATNDVCRRALRTGLITDAEALRQLFQTSKTQSTRVRF